MPNISAQISSIGSYPIAMNWRGGSPTTLAVSLGSTTMTTDFTLNYTLDDIMLSSNPFWFGMSSQGITSGSSSGAVHFSSALADTGIVIQVQVPVGAVRLNSTAISSSFLRFQVIQGESW